MSTIFNAKTRLIVAWCLTAMLGMLFLFSAISKFMRPEMMTQLHLQSWRFIIPIGEIVSAVLFMIPRTNFYGTLLLSSYMGGAIIIHMTNDMSILFPSAVLLVVWTASFLRNPHWLTQP